MSQEEVKQLEDLSLKPQEDVANNNGGEDDDIVDPWNVVSKSEAGVNYEKLIGI